jgi:hypothetical protein
MCLHSVTRIALLFYMQIIFVPLSKHNYQPAQSVTAIALIFLYVDDVRTSQETHLCSSTVCFGESFTFYMQMFCPDRTHIYGPPRPVSGKAFFYM